MGKASQFLSGLGSGLLDAGKNAITGGFGGLISNGFSALTSSLFGPSISKQIRLQKEAQMELNQQAAELNYEFGEKSAENAYKRQLEMYERLYNDQSYKAMRKQMEDAGLSVGLMYGGSGSGGGAGQMTGAPQGETGGAVAGNAAEALGLSVEMEKLRMQQQMTTAEVNLKNAQAAEARSASEKMGEESETERAVRQVRAELMKQEGMQTWIENVRRRWTDMESLLTEDGEPEDYVTEHELYGTYMIAGKSLNNQTAIAEASAAQLRALGVGLTNDQIREGTRKLTQDIITGRAEAALKRAQELETLARKQQIRLETGEETNWKTWFEVGVKSIDTLCRVANVAQGFIGIKGLARMLKGIAKKRSGGSVPREYEELLDGFNGTF